MICNDQHPFTECNRRIEILQNDRNESLNENWTILEQWIEANNELTPLVDIEIIEQDKKESTRKQRRLDRPSPSVPSPAPFLNAWNQRSNSKSCFVDGVREDRFLSYCCLTSGQPFAHLFCVEDLKCQVKTM